jgi:hypothetical protein
MKETIEIQLNIEERNHFTRQGLDDLERRDGEASHEKDFIDVPLWPICQ